MLIRMLKDRDVSPNGYRGEVWAKGSEHHHDDGHALGLCRHLVEIGDAEEVKARKAAPENKARA